MGSSEPSGSDHSLMPWTFAAAAFSANLNAIPSAESLLQDPFAVDGLVASRSHASAALGDIAPAAHAPGSDGTGGGDSSGSGAQSASSAQQNGFAFDSNSPGQPNILLPPGVLGNTFGAAAGGTSANLSPLGPTGNQPSPLAYPGNPNAQAQPTSPQPTGPGGSPPASPPAGPGPGVATGPAPDTLPDFNSCG